MKLHTTYFYDNGTGTGVGSCTITVDTYLPLSETEVKEIADNIIKTNSFKNAVVLNYIELAEEEDEQ